MIGQDITPRKVNSREYLPAGTVDRACSSTMKVVDANAVARASSPAAGARVGSVGSTPSGGTTRVRMMHRIPSTPEDHGVFIDDQVPLTWAEFRRMRLRKKDARIVMNHIISCRATDINDIKTLLRIARRANDLMSDGLSNVKLEIAGVLKAYEEW